MLDVRCFKRGDGSFDNSRWFVCFIHPFGDSMLPVDKRKED